MAGAVKFRESNVPRQPGEVARIKCVQGPDYGSVFVFTAGRVTLGRGEENDVMISDLKASRSHAEITATPGGWAIKDAGSANGISHNGRAQRSGILKTGDTFTLGETTFEFLAQEAATQLLIAPPRSFADIQAQQSAFAARTQGLLGSLGGSNGKPSPLLLGATGLAVLVMLMSGSPKAPIFRRAVQPSRSLAEYLPQVPLTPETQKTVDQLFKTGFREYTEGHFGRARTQFETVLQIAPSHTLASLYLENANHAIDKEVKFHLEQGARDIDAGRLNEARSHFEAIQRLMYKDPTSAGFIEAGKQLEAIDKAEKEGAG